MYRIFGLVLAILLALCNPQTILARDVICGVGYIKELRLHQHVDGDNWTNIAVVIDSTGFTEATAAGDDYYPREGKNWIHLDYSTASGTRTRLEWDGLFGKMSQAFLARLPVYIQSNPQNKHRKCAGNGSRVQVTICRTEGLCNLLKPD